MSFLETPAFPLGIAKNSVGGAVYSNERVITGSGARFTNIRWDSPDFEIDVATGIRSVEDLYSLQSFHHAVKAAHGFRFLFIGEWKSCSPIGTPAATDQVLVADAVAGQTEIQLIKTWASGAMSTVMNITKPHTGSLLLKKNNDILTTGFSLDTTTGIITMTTPLSAHDVISAGYTFDLPMQFAEDNLPRNFSAYRFGDVSVKLVMYR
ncbi:MAG: DUF2460 domain-containing protein [Pseudomonadota bacterium]